LRTVISQLKNEKVDWRSLDGGTVYFLRRPGYSLVLRLNNFPDEPLYTVFGLGDAVDVEDARELWKLVDEPMDNLESEKSSLWLTRKVEEWGDEAIEWTATSSPLVFKYETEGEVVFWKFNVDSRLDHTLVCSYGAIDLDKAPDNWTIRKASELERQG
jgi:hypothetical protein